MTRAMALWTHSHDPLVPLWSTADRFIVDLPHDQPDVIWR